MENKNLSVLFKGLIKMCKKLKRSYCKCFTPMVALKKVYDLYINTILLLDFFYIKCSKKIPVNKKDQSKNLRKANINLNKQHPLLTIKSYYTSMGDVCRDTY